MEKEVTLSKRANLDFSKHEVTEIKSDELLIHHIAIPNTRMNSVRFINTNGILAVTGDFGNWVFCREFHPDADTQVSDGYWDQKLKNASAQKSHDYCSESTLQSIEDFCETFEEDYGRVMTEDERDWVELLRLRVDDEISYSIIAYNDTPEAIHYEDVPFVIKRKVWLDCVYDAFDEICNRMRV